MQRFGRRIFVCALGAAALMPRDALAEPEPAGETVDYAWDGRDIGHPERAWLGRAYLPKATQAADGPRPLVVFLHGLNAALIKYRWMGGGSEGDVRTIVGKLVEDHKTEPVVVAAPSSVVASQVTRGASWGAFDLDHFIDRTREALSGKVNLDERRIVVAGHSGAGCSMQGGLAKVNESKRRLLAIFAIDTCMSPALAEALARSDPKTHVVVGYQTLGWTSRPFKGFESAFRRGVEAHPAREGVLRELDRQRPERAYHDQTVPLTFARWLPKVLPPKG